MRILLALATLLIGTPDGYAQAINDRDIYGGVTSLKGTKKSLSTQSQIATPSYIDFRDAGIEFYYV
jgi:hypothetical protein